MIAWSSQRCSSDPVQEMSEGMVKDIARFPWIGIVQHTFVFGDRAHFAVTVAVLIHPGYAIASADDVAKIPSSRLTNSTKLLLWGKSNTEEIFTLDVKDYILHPQYKTQVTFATIALLDLVVPEDASFNSHYPAPVLPVCLPITGAGTYEDMYSVKLTDKSGQIEKETLKMEYVGNDECETFYIEKQLNIERYNPVSPICAVSMSNKTPCVWDAGTALIIRQSWSYWQLIGFALRGPGCGAPAKFLSIHDYLPWINDIIVNSALDGHDPDGEYRFGVRRLSPYKLIMYNAGVIMSTQQGQCRKSERGGVLYQDKARITVNKPLAQGFYFVSVSQVAEFLCAEVSLSGATHRTNAAVWVEHDHHCDDNNYHNDGRPGNGLRLECFLYFKSTAFIEFRFVFGFAINISVILYGKLKEESKGPEHPFRKQQSTTAWWPTPKSQKLRMGSFVPVNLNYYNL